MSLHTYSCFPHPHLQLPWHYCTTGCTFITFTAILRSNTPVSEIWNLVERKRGGGGRSPIRLQQSWQEEPDQEAQLYTFVCLCTVEWVHSWDQFSDRAQMERMCAFHLLLLLVLLNTVSQVLSKIFQNLVKCIIYEIQKKIFWFIDFKLRLNLYG